GRAQGDHQGQDQDPDQGVGDGGEHFLGWWCVGVLGHPCGFLHVHDGEQQKGQGQGGSQGPQGGQDHPQGGDAPVGWVGDGDGCAVGFGAGVFLGVLATGGVGGVWLVFFG